MSSLKLCAKPHEAFAASFAPAAPAINAPTAQTSMNTPHIIMVFILTVTLLSVLSATRCSSPTMKVIRKGITISIIASTAMRTGTMMEAVLYSLTLLSSFLIIYFSKKFDSESIIL